MCTGAEIGLLLMGGASAAAGAKSLMGGDGTDSAALALAEKRQQDALKAQEKASAQAKAAADSASETARLAQEQRMRKVGGAGAFGASFTGNFAPAPVGVRTAFGQ